MWRRVAGLYIFASWEMLICSCVGSAGESNDVCMCVCIGEGVEEGFSRSKIACGSSLLEPCVSVRGQILNSYWLLVILQASLGGTVQWIGALIRVPLVSPPNTKVPILLLQQFTWALFYRGNLVYPGHNTSTYRLSCVIKLLLKYTFTHSLSFFYFKIFPLNSFFSVSGAFHYLKPNISWAGRSKHAEKNHLLFSFSPDLWHLLPDRCLPTIPLDSGQFQSSHTIHSCWVGSLSEWFRFSVDNKDQRPSVVSAPFHVFKCLPTQSLSFPKNAM